MRQFLRRPFRSTRGESDAKASCFLLEQVAGEHEGAKATEKVDPDLIGAGAHATVRVGAAAGVAFKVGESLLVAAIKDPRSLGDLSAGSRTARPRRFGRRHRQFAQVEWPILRAAARANDLDRRAELLARKVS